MFGFFKRKRIGGEIAFYGLKDWWLNSFTSEEQTYITKKFQPLGTGSSNSLITGSISWSTGSVVSFLQGLSDWFNNPRDRHISIRILEKAEELSKHNHTRVLDKHFLYHQIIITYYPERNSNPNALEKAISACRDQIALAPLAAKAFRKEWRGEPLPSHTGYKQLVIILEKQKKFQEAIDLCKEALKTKWNGDWENRIKRLNKKLKKTL